MLEKKIEELGEYFDGILKLKDKHTAVRVIIPENWKIYNKDNGSGLIRAVKVADNNITKVLFIGNDEVKLTDIMDFAKQVIMNNIENEVKKELFQTKVTELAEIFDNNQLSTLENLVFKFEKPKKLKSSKTEDVDLFIEKTPAEEQSKSEATKHDKIEIADDMNDDIDSKISKAIALAQSKKNNIC